MRRWPTNLGLMVLGAVLIRIVTGREWCAPIRSKEPPQSGDGPTRGMLVLWRWRLCSRAEQRTQARGSLAYSLARVPADLLLSWRRTLETMTGRVSLGGERRGVVSADSSQGRSRARGRPPAGGSRSSNSGGYLLRVFVPKIPSHSLGQRANDYFSIRLPVRLAALRRALGHSFTE